MPADAEMQFQPDVLGFPRRAGATSGCSRLAVRVKMGWLPRSVRSRERCTVRSWSHVGQCSRMTPEVGPTRREAGASGVWEDRGVSGAVEPPVYPLGDSEREL